ncbi:MAG: hypothetical protein ACK53H_10970 [Betaproteobacteria bacterium]|jgi:hypothetical protein
MSVVNSTVKTTLSSLSKLEAALTDRQQLDQLSPELASAIRKVMGAKAALINLGDRLQSDIAKEKQ